MVATALLLGLIAGCTVGVRGLAIVLGLIVLSMPSLWITAGALAVGKAVLSIVLIQVGYAGAALVPPAIPRAFAPVR